MSLLLPLLILSLPLADMSAVIMGRLSEGVRHLSRSTPSASPLVAGWFQSPTHGAVIYVFTQWLAALALVVANAEMRFLVALATAILVATVVLSWQAADGTSLE